MIVQEDEYKELVIIAHTMEDNYGHFFDSVIPFEDVDFVLKQVMYEIRWTIKNVSNWHLKGQNGIIITF